MAACAESARVKVQNICAGSSSPERVHTIIIIIIIISGVARSRTSNNKTKKMQCYNIRSPWRASESGNERKHERGGE